MAWVLDTGRPHNRKTDTVQETQVKEIKAEEVRPRVDCLVCGVSLLDRVGRGVTVTCRSFAWSFLLSESGTNPTLGV